MYTADAESAKKQLHRGGEDVKDATKDATQQASTYIDEAVLGPSPPPQHFFT